MNGGVPAFGTQRTFRLLPRMSAFGEAKSLGLDQLGRE